MFYDLTQANLQAYIQLQSTNLLKAFLENQV